jgi:hypothetical protein
MRRRNFLDWVSLVFFPNVSYVTFALTLVLTLTAFPTVACAQTQAQTLASKIRH